MAAWITFGELKKLVNKDTKELVVPSRKKLEERKTRKVISGRFGEFEKIKVVQGGKILFMTEREGNFEDVTFYPVGGTLAGHDLSVVNRRVVVRWDDEVAFSIDEADTEVEVIINGGDDNEMHPYNRKKYMDVPDEAISINVYADGSVVYRAGGRQTVFALCQCRDHRYPSVTGEVCIREEELAGLSWEIRLVMYAEDRLAHNNLNHKKEIAWSSVDEDGEDMTDSDARLWKLFYDEYQRSGGPKDLAEEILLSLEDTERRIMELYFFERESQKEIAEALGLARETVSRKMTRIISKLQKLYGSIHHRSI